MRYILIPEKDLNSRIEELIPQSKHNEKVGEYDGEGTIISELQSLKQKGEEVEVEEITDDDLTHNSLEFLRNNGYKLIKTKL